MQPHSQLQQKASRLFAPSLLQMHFRNLKKDVLRLISGSQADGTRRQKLGKLEEPIVLLGKSRHSAAILVLVLHVKSHGGGFSQWFCCSECMLSLSAEVIHRAASMQLAACWLQCFVPR